MLLKGFQGHGLNLGEQFHLLGFVYVVVCSFKKGESPVYKRWEGGIIFNYFNISYIVMHKKIAKNKILDVFVFDMKALCLF